MLYVLIDMIFPFLINLNFTSGFPKIHLLCMIFLIDEDELELKILLDKRFHGIHKG